MGLGFEAVAFFAVEVAFARAVGFAFGFAFGFALGFGLALVVDLDAAVFGFAGDFLDPVVVGLDAAAFRLGETGLAPEVFALVVGEVAFALVWGLALDRLGLGDEDPFGFDAGFTD